MSTELLIRRTLIDHNYYCKVNINKSVAVAIDGKTDNYTNYYSLICPIAMQILPFNHLIDNIN